MVEPRLLRMIQPCPPSTTSTTSSIPSPTPPWRGAVQVHLLGKERPDRLTEFVQLSQEKNRPINELLERPGTAKTETNQRLTRKGDRLGNLEGVAFERKVRAGSCPSPQPVLNSNAPPGRAPERLRNSTAISTDQRCRKYCEGRSRPPRVTQAPRPPAVDPC